MIERVPGKTCSYASMAQQSSGFSGCVKLGNASTSRAAVASSKGANGMPASSPWSASRPHSPPDSETAAMRRPRGQRRRPSTSSVSSNSWKSLTSMAPWCRSNAEKARAEPTTAPECASAARAAACERPTLRQTTGLPASAAAARAATNASGRRIVSTKRPIARVPSSSARNPTKSARSRESSLPAETTVRKPTRGPQARNASPIEPEWATQATCPGTKASVPATVPSQSETPPGVAMPMQFGPTTATSHSAARAPMRAATARPSAPASAPSPGSTTARTPAAITSSKAASARVCPTSR